MKKTIMGMAVIAAVSSTAFAAANTAACKGCHGQDFEKKAMNVSKVVKDMSKADIIAAMKGYKDGSYGGNMKGIMAGQVKALDDAAIEDIATQIAGDEKKAEKAPEAASNAAEAKEKAEKSVTDEVVDAAKEKATEAVKEVANVAVDAAADKAAGAATGLLK